MALMDREDDQGRVERNSARSIRHDALDDILTMEEKFRVTAFNHLVDKMSYEQAAELLKDMHKHLIAKNRVMVNLMKDSDFGNMSGVFNVEEIVEGVLGDLEARPPLEE